MKNNEEKNNSQKEVNEVYEKPMIEIIEMEIEGILCSSGDNYKPGGGWGN